MPISSIKRFFYYLKKLKDETLIAGKKALKEAVDIVLTSAKDEKGFYKKTNYTRS